MVISNISGIFDEILSGIPTMVSCNKQQRKRQLGVFFLNLPRAGATLDAYSIKEATKLEISPTTVGESVSNILEAKNT